MKSLERNWILYARNLRGRLHEKSAGVRKMLNEREEKYWRYRKYRELLEKAESMERKLKMMEMEMWKICRLIQELGDEEEDDF